MLFDNKEWNPGEDLRPAIEAERELLMKYCDTVKESDSVYVSSGVIEDILYNGKGIFDEDGLIMGLSHVDVGTSIGMAGPMNALQFKVNFHNGYNHLLNSMCVLFTRDKDLKIEVKPNTACKIYWVKKGRKYDCRFIIPEGVTQNTPTCWCRMCAKESRVEDVTDGICPHCGKPVDSGVKEFLGL